MERKLKLQKKKSNKETVETYIVAELVDTTDTPNQTSAIESNDKMAGSNNVQLKFEEFILEIDDIYVWDEENKLKETQIDTAIVYLELGETIEGKLLRIEPLIDGELKVYQRFENSVTVMNEGPHCDLTEWKHYVSEWKRLKIYNGKFLTESYSEEDLEKFIEIDMMELQEAVKVNVEKDG